MEDFINQLDPCCGVPLRRCTKCIALIDLVNSIGTGVFVAFALIITLFYGDDISMALEKDKAEFPDENNVYQYFGTGLVLWALLLTLIVSALYFLLAQSLLHGAQQKDVFKVTRWLYVTVALLGLRIFGLILGAFMATNSGGLIFFGILSILYTIYCLLVVYKFRRELLTEEGLTLNNWDTGRRYTNMQKI